MYCGGLLAIAVRVNGLDMFATLLYFGVDPNESVVTDDGPLSSGTSLAHPTEPASVTSTEAPYAESVVQHRPGLPTFVGNPGSMYDETPQS